MNQHMLPSISNLLGPSHEAPLVSLSPPSPLHISPFNIPLEGDDPPQRLRLPLSPQSPKLLYKSTWPTLSPTPSSSTSSSSTASFDVSSSSISPSLELFSRSRTTSEDNYRRRVTSNSPPPVIERQRSVSTSSAPPVPSTQIVFDSSGQPVLKRRRGRPPTMRHTNQFDGGWTFLTPTVWDVHVSEEQKEREIQADHKERLISATVIPNSIAQNDHLMNDAMAAFTNSNMDTILHMPRKKRGRKPKTHIVGNSCFVWKDLTSTRSASVKQTK
jgi:hypothetical protein